MGSYSHIECYVCIAELLVSEAFVQITNSQFSVLHFTEYPCPCVSHRPSCYCLIAVHYYEVTRQQNSRTWMMLLLSQRLCRRFTTSSLLTPMRRVSLVGILISVVVIVGLNHSCMSKEMILTWFWNYFSVLLHRWWLHAKSYTEMIWALLCVYNFTCNHVWSWNEWYYFSRWMSYEIISAILNMLENKLFQMVVGGCWNNCEIILFEV